MYLITMNLSASKTGVCVYDSKDKSSAMLDFDSVSYGKKSVNEVRNNLKNMFLETLESLNVKKEEVSGVVVGITGLQNKSDKDALKKVFLDLEIEDNKVFLANDCELVMYAVSAMPGICIVAKKGSVGYAYDEKLEVLRCGGHGAPLSDLGSGYFIGTQILKEYLKYLDEQVPYLAIFDEVENFFGKKRPEMLEFIKNMTNDEISSVAKMVLDNAEDGDPLCEIIAKGAAFNLANIVATLYKKINTSDAFKVDVCMIGNIFENQYLTEFFKEQCKEQTTYNKFNFMKVTLPLEEIYVEFAKTIFTV